jgi:hypothetical protein
VSAFPSRRSAAAPGAEPGRFRRWFGGLRLHELAAIVGVGLWFLWPVLFQPKPPIRTAMVV